MQEPSSAAVYFWAIIWSTSKTNGSSKARTISGVMNEDITLLCYRLYKNYLKLFCLFINSGQITALASCNVEF